MGMETTFNRRDKLIFSGILLIALAVRLWDLGAKSLWYDEACSWGFALQPLMKILIDVKETNPPLYYVLLHFWINLFGTSEIAMRSLSVLFGISAVGLTGWIGCLLGGKRLALVSMSLMAIMPMPIEYSQMARTYSLFLASSLASYGCLLAWEQRQQRRWALGYVITTVTMCYSHNYWVFNFLAQQLYMAWHVFHRRVSLWRWLGLSIVVILGYFPWLVVLIKQTLYLKQKGFWIPVPNLKDLLDTFSKYVTIRTQLWLVWFYLVLAGLGLKTMKNSTRGLLLVWMLCPFLVPFVWSQIQMPIFWTRYTIAAIPALYLLIGQGILSIPNRIGKGLVLFVIIITTATSLNYFYKWEHEAWRSLILGINESVQSGDVIAVAGYKNEPFDYYYKGHIPYHKLSPTKDLRNPQEYDQLLQNIIAGHQRILIVQKQREKIGKGKKLLTVSFLERYDEAELIHKRRFKGNLFLFVYELPPDSSYSNTKLNAGSELSVQKDKEVINELD